VPCGLPTPEQKSHPGVAVLYDYAKRQSHPKRHTASDSFEQRLLRTVHQPPKAANFATFGGAFANPTIAIWAEVDDRRHEIFH
jgi:hypothetical protein